MKNFYHLFILGIWVLIAPTSLSQNMPLENFSTDSMISELRRGKLDKDEIQAFSAHLNSKSFKGNTDSVLLIVLDYAVDEEHHDITYFVQNQLINYYQIRRQTDKIEHYCLQNISLLHEEFPDSSLIGDLAFLGRNYVEMGDFTRADSVLKQTEALIPKFPDDPDIYKLYSAKGVKELYGGNYKGAIAEAKKGLPFCLDSKPAQLRHMTSILTNAFTELSQFDSALRYQNITMQTFLHDTLTIQYANILATKGIIYFEQSEYAESIDWFQRAFEIYAASDNLIGVSSMNNELGLIYLKLKDYTQAAEKFAAALEQIQPFNHPNFEAIFKSNLGLAYLKMGDYDLARTLLDETMEFSQEHGFYEVLHRTSVYLSSCLWNMGEKERAEKLISKTLEDAKTRERPKEILSALLGTSEMMIKDNPGQGQYLLREAYNLAKDKKMWSQLIKIEEQFVHIFEQLGRYDSAYAHMVKVNELHASAFNDKLLSEMAYYDHKISVLERENTIKSQEKEIVSLENEKRLYIIFVILIIAACLLIVLALGWYFHYQKTKEKIRQKQKSTEQLLHSIELEQQRIAQDLHDGLGQQLLVIKGVITKSANSSDVQIIDDTIEEMRRVSHNLYPLKIERQGLEKSLESMLRETEDNFGIITHIEVDEGLDALPIDKQVILFRLTQECVQNAVKHAHPKSVRIDVKRIKNTWNVTIQDNGLGFDSKTFINGLGFKSIRNRIDALGGKIDVQSDKNTGTKINIAFTYEEKNHLTYSR